MARSPKTSLRFTHLELRNWRNFTEVDVSLPPRGFLVGPNACGKSNLLDVLRFLREIVSIGGGFQEAVRRRGGVSNLRCLAARRYSDVRLHVSIGHDDLPSQWEYELCFNQDAQRRPIIKSESVHREGREVLQRPDEKDKQDADRLTQTYLEQVYANQEFRQVADFVATVSYLHIVPQLVREPDRSVGRRQDPFGGDFLEQIALTTPKTRDARLRRIVETLRVAVPQLQHLKLDQDARGSPHLRGKYENWRPQGAWQSEEQFSDGTLRLLGLLWAMLSGSGPLLLEEPELSLHPEAVRQIPQMFARTQRHTGRQVLVSTHSPELLLDSGIGLDEVFLLCPGAEGTSVQPASRFRQVETLLREGVPLPEAVMPLTRPANMHQLGFFPDL